MKKHLLVILCLLLFFCGKIYAQARAVTGKVTAKDDGLPIPGATVRILGSNTGTQTNANGIFILNNVPDNATLAVSFIGYATQQVAVNGRSNISILLVSNASQLNEVVVTGVGAATEKRRVPIDVATVSSSNFAKTTTTDIQQALVGQIAGAQVQQTSGQPNSGFNIILRGVTNFGNGSPIILVDGVQIGTDASALSNLDPNNIDRVEVVKGAAGGMLYGAQGANGVIQIFTKKGTLNSKLQINVNTKMSVDQILRANDLVAQYHHFTTNSAGAIVDANGNVLAPDAVGFWANPAEDDPAAKTTLNNKTYNLPTYDHISQGYRTAYTYTNNVSLTGGGEKADYAFTASRLDQQDVFSNTYKRTNIGINLGVQLAKGLTFRSSTQAFITDDNLLGGNRFALVNSYPWIDFNYRGPDGHLVLKPKDENQLNSLSEREWHKRYNRESKFVQNFDLNYKFPKFVELDYKYGITYDINDGNNLYYNQTTALQQDLHWGPSANGSLRNDYGKSTFANSLASLFFRTDFKNDFNLNIPIRTITQVSYDYRRSDYRSYFSQGVGLQTYPPYNISSATTKNAGDYYSNFLTYGVLVNQTIEYGNLLGISGGFRSDYSSVFGAGSKPFTFPRGTIFFNPSELIKASFLDNWKLRAAYGKAGIQPDVYTNQLTLSPTTAFGSFGALSVPTVAANPNLRVQTSEELELGTDVTFLLFKNNSWFNRLTFSGTYWTRKSGDVIQPALLAPSTGFATLYDNFATIKQHGVDLSLDTRAYNSDNLVWNLGVRWGFSKSRVQSIAGNQDYTLGAPFILRAGEEVGALYGQYVLGSLDAVRPDGTPYIAAADRSNYTLVNGNVVDTRTNTLVISDANDKKIIGKTYPDFSASLINTFTFFKNLTLSFQFDWVHGGDIYNQTRQWLYRDRISKDFDKSVNIGGQNAPFVSYYNSAYNTALPLSYFVENGSFVRLRDLSLTYDVSKFIHTTWLRRLAVTLAARNLVTFTKYTGLDPENTGAVNSQGASQLGVGAIRGVDYFGIPNLRSYQVGLSLGF